METKIIKKIFIPTSLIVLLVILGSCCPPFCPEPREPDITCSKSGSHSLFVATFDGDAVGSLPAPSTPLQYGPPGASLNLQGATNTIVVTNSASLASKALKMIRGQPGTNVDAVAGHIDGELHTAGTYYIDFKAHGEVIPQHLIAGMVISVLSTENHSALNLKLFDGSYHLRQGNSYDRLTGAYDPGKAHSVHIELNLDKNKFSVCINDEVVASNKAFFQDNFANLHLLRFFAPPTVTEAFLSTYVVDEIRITK
jgi:hypothetical protein